MEKNRIRSVKTGKSMRMSYQRQKEVLEMPNLIEVQKDSYKWFLDEGLKEVFDDISPIADYGGKLSLEFIDFTYDAKDAKYTIEQCKERDVTYAAPLKVRVRLINKETEEINEHEIFMAHFVYDSYRRFVQMYGDVVMGLKPVNKEDIDPFEAVSYTHLVWSLS